MTQKRQGNDETGLVAVTLRDTENLTRRRITLTFPIDATHEEIQHALSMATPWLKKRETEGSSTR